MIKLLLIQNIFPSKGIEVVKAYSNISRMHENVGIKQSDTDIETKNPEKKFRFKLFQQGRKYEISKNGAIVSFTKPLFKMLNR